MLSRPFTALQRVLVIGFAAAVLHPVPAAFAQHAHHAAFDSPEHAAEMSRRVAAWYAAHPAHGGTTILGAGADTFLVRNFQFDADGNAGTQIDTATVLVGQSVLFKWEGGFHTTTSGNPGDPDEGALWDHPIDSFATENMEFAVTFPNAGTFPFFCQPHWETANMKGVVVVRTSVDVPGPAPVAQVGFTRSPAPNPTRGGIDFQFTTSKPGPALAEVFDAAGRRVTRVFDRSFTAGTHPGRWSGAGDTGGRVAAGVYYLRIRTPEFDQTRRVAVER